MRRRWQYMETGEYGVSAPGGYGKYVRTKNGA